VCVAGVLLGKCARTLHAQLPGGPLKLEWPSDAASVRMTGAATEVFEGEVDLDALAGALASRELVHGVMHGVINGVIDGVIDGVMDGVKHV
jgi:hypothetical protein